MQKKGKCIFNFEIHTKKNTQIYLDFSLLYPLCIFCFLNFKIHAKKDKIFQIAKMYMQKKSRKYYFKKTGKKAEMQKKQGVYKLYDINR